MQWLFFVAAFWVGVWLGYRLRTPRVEYRWREVPVERIVYVPLPERVAARMRGTR